MTAELVLRFPWGRYHATPWGRHLNEGAVDWPPSPWRLLRAFYSVWQFRAPELDVAVVHSLLDKLAAPPAYVLPQFTRGATRHYLPGIDHREGIGAVPPLAVDAFVVLSRASELRIRWNVELTEDERRAFETLAGRLTYLGRAESLCDAAVVEPDPNSSGGACRPLPPDATDDAVDVLAPRSPIDIDSLTVSTTEIRTKQRLRHPPGAVAISYRRPEPEPLRILRLLSAPPPVSVVRWSLAGRALPSRHVAVAVAARLRQRVMQQFGDRGAPSAVSGKLLDGHRHDGEHDHAHWLAFGKPGGRLLETVIAWAPMGFDADVAAVMGGARQLRAGGVRDFGPQRLGLEGWGDPADIVPELFCRSAEWTSFTPYAPAIHRHRNMRSELDFVRAAIERERRWRPNLPPLLDVQLLDGPWGAYRTHRPDKERLRDRRRVWGVRLVFDGIVTGPLALGQLSHFGLGLFVPVRQAGGGAT